MLSATMSAMPTPASRWCCPFMDPLALESLWCTSSQQRRCTMRSHQQTPNALALTAQATRCISSPLPRIMYHLNSDDTLKQLYLWCHNAPCPIHMPLPRHLSIHVHCPNRGWL